MAQDPSYGLLPEYEEEPGLSVDDLSPAGLARAKAAHDAWAQRTKIKSAEMPQQSDLAKQLYEQQKKAVADYRTQIPGLSDELYGNAEKQTRRQLKTDIKGIKNDYNARGLLNSGARMATEAGANASADASLLQTRQNINQGLLNNLEGMESGQFGLASMLAQPGPNVASPYLQGVGTNISTEMQNQQATQGALGSLGQAAGTLGGYGLAGMMMGRSPRTNVTGTNVDYTPYNANLTPRTRLYDL